jgi:hypothetical protein
LSGSPGNSVWNKIVWAQELLRCLEREVATYVQDGPYTADAEAITEPSGYRVRARLRQPVPGGISLLLGDFVHNLRSSLDHLARALVIINGGTPVDQGRPGVKRTAGPLTAFPIRDIQPPKGGVTVAGGVSAHALALIEKAQPYNASNLRGLPLLLLAELDNIDKHRALNVTSSAVVQSSVYLQFPGDDTVLGGQPHFGRYEDGADIAWFPMPLAPDEPQVIVHPHLRVEVTVEDPIIDGDWLTIPDVCYDMLNTVAVVIGLLGT